MELSFLSGDRRILARLLSAVIKKGEFSPISHANIDWSGVLTEAQKHQVLTLLYPLLSEIGHSMGLSDDQLEELRIASLYDGKEEERKHFDIRKVLLALSDANIPVIVLKGLVLRELYPHPCLRTMTDVDILVRPDDMDRAGNVLEGIGYIKGPMIEKHTDYSHATLPHIELHRKLTSEFQADIKTDFDDEVWSRAVEVTVGDAVASSLCPQDEVLYLLLHMASHFISSGFGLRQLCDLVLVLESNRGSIDFAILMEQASRMHIEVFAGSVFRICRFLFDLRLPEVNLSRGTEEELLDRSVLEIVFDGGIYGKNNIEDFAVSRMIYYSGDKSSASGNGRFRYLINIMFPPLEKLDIRYSYAHEHHWLLPVAWAHRLCYILVRKDLDFSFKSAVFASVSPTGNYNKRVALLKRLGLLE